MSGNKIVSSSWLVVRGALRRTTNHKLQTTNRKAFVFSLDAVIALVLVLFAFTFAVSISSTRIESQLQNYEQLHFMAHDSMEVLSQIGILDEIGALWATGNCTTSIDNDYCVNAANLARTKLAALLPTNVNYALLFQNDTVDQIANAPLANSSGVAITTRVASGFTKGRAQTGFVARAYATKVNNRTTTRTFPVHTSGSGWSAKEFVLLKNITLPNDATISNGTLYLSIHSGSAQANPEFKQLKVNGNQLKDNVVWRYTGFDSGSNSRAAFGTVDATAALQAGNNTLEMRVSSPQYNAHIHPGMYFTITMRTNQSFVELGNVKHKEYLDYYSGDNGVWAIIPYTVPKNATGVTAAMHLEAESVRNLANEFSQYGHYDVEVYVNNATLFFSDAAPNATPIYDFNLTSVSVTGTNVIAIYINSYGDTAWGQQETIISPRSFIEVNYSSPIQQYGFGEIDITTVKEFGGANSNPKDFNFTIPAEIEKLYDSNVNLVEGFSNQINVSAWNQFTSPAIAYKAPTVRASPTKIYVSPDYWLINGTNSIRLRDFQPGGGLSANNLILQWTAVDYTHLARVAVPYGNVFDSQSNATSDAYNRLEQRATVQGVNLSDILIANETIQIGGVPTLWGPERFTLQLWQ